MSDEMDEDRRAAVIEEIASDFHEVWEELAPSHGHATQEATRVPWHDLPESIRKLTMEVVEEVLKRTVDKVDNAEKAKDQILIECGRLAVQKNGLESELDEVRGLLKRYKWDEARTLVLGDEK
jgi:hypothetical protein